MKIFFNGWIIKITVDSEMTIFTKLACFILRNKSWNFNVHAINRKPNTYGIFYSDN